MWGEVGGSGGANLRARPTRRVAGWRPRKPRLRRLQGGRMSPIASAARTGRTHRAPPPRRGGAPTTCFAEPSKPQRSQQFWRVVCRPGRAHLMNFYLKPTKVPLRRNRRIENRARPLRLVTLFIPGHPITTHPTAAARRRAAAYAAVATPARRLRAPITRARAAGGYSS